MSINLHELVGDTLTIVNDWQTLVFTKTLVVWNVGRDTPTPTTKRLIMRGKIQPASLAELRELGLILNNYQYFKIFITGTPTQIDRLNQFGTDTFTCGGYKYKIVAGERWDDAGWREMYAYRINTDNEDGNTNTISNVSSEPHA